MKTIDKHQYYDEVNLIRYTQILRLKPCYICRKNDEDQDKLILCDGCDDAYHIHCLEKFVNKQIWLCQFCRKSYFLYEMANKVVETASSMQKKRCYLCIQKIESDDSEMELKAQLNIFQAQQIRFDCSPVLGDEIKLDPYRKCRFCQNYFHRKCFSKRINSVCCSSCQINIRKQCPKSQKQFNQYLNSDMKKIQDLKLMTLKSVPNFLKPKITLKKIGFILPEYLQNEEIRVRFRFSLYYALCASKLHYCHDQLYPNMDIMQLNRPQNNAIFPFHDLDQHDEKVFKQFLTMTRNYQFVHVQIKEDEILGFYVIATSFIKQKTIISEYIGEVQTKRNLYQYGNNDSAMGFITTFFADTSLDITPKKFGNLSRFISGLKKGDQHQENIKSVTFSCQGRCRIVFYACKDIEEDQKLLLDYNGGQFEEYPTQNFIAQ